MAPSPLSFLVQIALVTSRDAYLMGYYFSSLLITAGLNV